MTIRDIIEPLERLAPLSYQESYDNAGLLTGSMDWECRGTLVTLDATEDVVLEAIARNCNLIVAHHPIIFKGLTRITGKNYIERAVITAIKNDIALYAIHTNLDNVSAGVSGKMADRLGLVNRTVLQEQPGTLKKLFTFVPVAEAEQLRNALFQAGAGRIGNYGDCSFSTEGMGSFTAGEGAEPFVGEVGKRHYEKEVKVEVVFPGHAERSVLAAMMKAHPYEEVAFDIVQLANVHPGVGAGIIGELPAALSGDHFLALLKERFDLKVIRHTALLPVTVRKIAVCGGAGSFLVARAMSMKADVFVSSDFKYHEFFNADGQLLIADIGHYESEQFTVDLLLEILRENFPTFALLKSKVQTNPVSYF